MKYVEFEIVKKAAEASFKGSLTDKKLVEIANEAEPDGADKNTDLIINIAKDYNIPISGYLMPYSEYTRDYRRDRIERLEEENVEEIVRAAKLGIKPDNDKLARNIREIEILKNKKDAEMVNVKRSLKKDLTRIFTEAQTSMIKTGFCSLDEKLGGGLRNGRLYGLGGITSLGKTTLALNIAENIATEIKDEKGNIAKAGRDVLIFSLEMARAELLAKNISRRTFEAAIKENPNDIENLTDDGGKNIIKEWGEKAVSLIDLYNSNYSTKEDKIAEIKEKYMEETAPRLNIMEGVGNITVDTVRLAVETFIEKNRPKLQPVIIIDFLQILSPLNERATDKQIVDRNISELKRLTRDLDVAVVAISSFNRQNYAEEVSFESFKESGSVEYSVDVLIGLQLWIKERKLSSNNEDNKRVKREAIDKAKKKNPREIELVILKNRIYKTGQSVFFKYFPAFDYFTNDNCDDLYEEKEEINNNKDKNDSEEKQINAEKKKDYIVKLDKNDPRVQRIPQ
jgi:replicative DNA helicase